MTIKYLSELRSLFQKVELAGIDNIKLEFEHFFSGAAVYANGKICATLSPAGFALKLSKPDIDSLLESKENKRLRYFPKSPIKKDYVVISDNIINNAESLSSLIRISIEFVSEPS